MHLSRSHTASLAACGLAAVVALTGCGAGQISQTALQDPSINGTGATAGAIALRNIHIKAAQDSDFIQPGRDVELIFTAANGSPDTDDRLLAVNSDIGAVTLAGDTTVPAGGVLVVGAPDGQPIPLQTAEAAESVQAKVALAKPITNGLTYNFTFAFQRAGQVSAAVPISAVGSQRRNPGDTNDLNVHP